MVWEQEGKSFEGNELLLKKKNLEFSNLIQKKTQNFNIDEIDAKRTFFHKTI